MLAGTSYFSEASIEQMTSVCSAGGKSLINIETFKQLHAQVLIQAIIKITHKDVNLIEN